MAGILEAIFQFIFEIFIEILFTFLGFIIDKTDLQIEKNKKLKLVLKYVISFTFFFIAILIIILSLSKNKNDLIALLSVILLLILVLDHLLSFINNNFLKKKFIKYFLFVIKEVACYAYFLTLLILFENFDEYHKTYILVSSIVGLVILIGVDSFRYRRYQNRKATKNVS